jgi:hypothetical protein
MNYQLYFAKYFQQDAQPAEVWMLHNNMRDMILVNDLS